MGCPRHLAALCLLAAASCAPDYSPNTYSSAAVQKAEKVARGVVIGYRQVKISASGTVGAVSGGAAGGVLGGYAGTGGIGAALGAIGGTAAGGLVGAAVEHTAGDTIGWEYVVKKQDGDLVSVTQREQTPLPVGQRVLVIAGNQARVVPDYAKAEEPPANPDQTGAKETPAQPGAGSSAAPGPPIPLTRPGATVPAGAAPH
jgi:outer membrane lipoprotein SlyB